MKKFLGTVVEESLADNRFLNELDILSVRISGAEKPEDRWHLYKVCMTSGQIEKLAEQLKPEKWYAHFWDDENIHVVFPGKTFLMNRDDKDTWADAISYGKSLDIPEEQLDFLIEE